MQHHSNPVPEPIPHAVPTCVTDADADQRSYRESDIVTHGRSNGGLLAWPFYEVALRELYGVVYCSPCQLGR